jgi:hypothetical protein
MLVLLAEVCAWTGQTEEGLCAINEALVAPGERLTEAERYRLKGQLLLQQAAADEAEAEASFHQALDIAHGWDRPLLWRSDKAQLLTACHAIPAV